MEVQTTLSRLTDAELVFCRGTPPQATFLFKHALVRDVAYGSLLRGQRQQLHGRIADVLAERFPTMVEAEPEVIAHHYREAGMADAASTYFERAGDRAAARSGYIEATTHFTAAIEEADRLPQKEERARRALALLLKLGPAIAVTIGDRKPEVEAVYRRARGLGREAGDGPKLFRATWGLWLCASRKDNKQSRKIVRGCDAKRNVLVYMVYSDRLIEGSPKNSTSSVPIMPWGQNDQIQKCADFLEK